MNSGYQHWSALVALALLSSCTSNSVGWGGRYEILQATNQSITIQYDKMMSSFKEIMGVAQAHCRKTGKSAVPVDEEKAKKVRGLVPTQTFRCE
jgi:hypothetical protein